MHSKNGKKVKGQILNHTISSILYYPCVECILYTVSPYIGGYILLLSHYVFKPLGVKVSASFKVFKTLARSSRLNHLIVDLADLGADWCSKAVPLKKGKRWCVKRRGEGQTAKHSNKAEQRKF